MMYSSGKRAKLTVDPAPFQALAGGENGARCGAAVLSGFERIGIAYRFSPRPEFDRPLNNPTNPILAEFRDLNAGRIVKVYPTSASLTRALDPQKEN